MSIAFITTFPTNSWDIYSKQMLQSFTQFMPAEMPLMVQLDDDLLFDQVDKLLRPQDGIAVGWEPEHVAFVERNKSKDDPTNYRKQATRFCHKVFAIHRAYKAALAQKAHGEGSPRYLVWLDSDVLITCPVTLDDIKAALPKEGDAVAYLGRKDWPHSECGWLAFDLENGGGKIIEEMHSRYVNDIVLSELEQHDSWIFDSIRPANSTNLTADKPGTEIWEHSPMATWSKHFKGPLAKQALAMGPQPTQRQQQGNIQIQTKNALPNEEICAHIAENQNLIKHWVRSCKPTNEEIVVVSAGPLFIAEDLRGCKKKIIAVKHAIEPLKKAGITPWAVILLDPRPHMINFVNDPDKEVIWFVASQVNPLVTKQLLDKGCRVFGYHASVGANEHELTVKQPDSVIHGGSATATRGLFLLKHLGFTKLKLYGYDLSFPDKPDLEAKDEIGQPKYLEISLGTTNPVLTMKRCFWTEPQLLAQLEEMRNLIDGNQFDIEAYGEGIVPFLVKMKKTTDLRINDLRGIMPKLSSYKRLIRWNKVKKTNFLTQWLRMLLNRLRKMRKTSK